MLWSLLSTLIKDEGRIGLLLRGSRCLVTLVLDGLFRVMGEGDAASRICFVTSITPALGD